MYQFPLQKTAMALLLLAATVASNQPASLCGQQQFIGEGQPVKRVIQLRSTTNHVPARAASQEMPQDHRLMPQTSKTASPVANPEQIKFDEITAKAKPIKNALGPIVQENSPLVPNSTLPSSSFPTQSKTWSGIQPKVPARQASMSTVASSSPMMVSKMASSLVTEINSPKFVNVNQSAQIQINLRNLGKDAVENVVFVATLPDHTKLASASPQPTKSEGQKYEFSVARVGGDDVHQVILNVIPTLKQPIDIATQLRIENQQRTLVSVRQPSLSLAFSGPQQTNIGQKVVHELIVSNVGDGVASNIQLDTVFPKQLQLIKQSLGPVIKSLEPGKSLKVLYESVASTPGPIELKITASTNDLEPQHSTIAVQVYQPEIRVSATGPKLNFVQRDGIYTIQVENTGEVDVTDIRVSLAVPAGMKVTTISRQAGVDAEKGVLTWTFDRIHAKSNEQIQLKATALEEGEQICNINVSSNETMEKEFVLATQVVTRANLSVRIKNLTGPVQVGGKAEFLVEVENQGSRQANDVNLRIALPPSVMSVKNNEQSVEQDENMLVFAEPQIAPGQKVAFKFTAVGVAKGEHVVRSILEMEGSERQVISEDTVYVYEVDEARVSESLNTPAIRR